MKSVIASNAARAAKASLPLLALGAMIALPETAMAADDTFADMFEGWSEQMDAFKAFFVRFAYLVGIVLIFTGAFYIYKDQKEEGRGHMKTAIIALVVGGLLVVFPSLVGWSAASVGGETSQQDDLTEDF